MNEECDPHYTTAPERHCENCGEECAEVRVIVNGKRVGQKCCEKQLRSAS